MKMEMEQEEQMEKKNGEKREEREEATEENFLKELYFFMKQRDTPIERIPHLGFKQIDLYLMFKTVKDLGGYHQVTAQQLWKKVYNILGGNPRSTSAATCSRRHYEKLLLPYEYHLAGYSDDIPITPPRKHKLTLSFDDQYFLSPKRALIRHASPFSQSTAHEFLTDGRVQIISMHGNVPHPSYIHPGPTSLPRLFSVPRSMPTNISTSYHTQTPVSYLPSSPFETESIKQPLEVLRHLAKEYKSSSGLAEPLNLSNKKSSLDITSSTPSSFSLPSSKKRPKFLNEALPMYSPKADQPGVAAGPSKLESPVQAVVNPMVMDESRVDNLSSSSTSSPNLKKATPSPIPSVHRPSYPSAFSIKPQEKSLPEPSTNAGSSSMPQPSSSQSLNNPPLDPYNGMEIQIPLSLLQNWLKEGLISSLSSSRQHSSGCLPHKPNKIPSPEPFSKERPSTEASEGTCHQQPAPQEPSQNSLSQGRINSESSGSLLGGHPVDLSLKRNMRDPVDTKKQDGGSIDSSMTLNESQLPTVNPYASVKPFIMPSSAKMRFSRDPYNQVSRFKPLQVEEQGSCLIQAHTSNKDSTGSKSPGYGVDRTPSLAGRLVKAADKAPLVKLNCPSLSRIQIVPEHLKFLLSNSSFRSEKGKIS